MPWTEVISVQEFEDMFGMSITTVAQVPTSLPHAALPGSASACGVAGGGGAKGGGQQGQEMARSLEEGGGHAKWAWGPEAGGGGYEGGGFRAPDENEEPKAPKEKEEDEAKTDSEKVERYRKEFLDQLERWLQEEKEKKQQPRPRGCVAWALNDRLMQEGEEFWKVKPKPGKKKKSLCLAAALLWRFGQ